MMKSPASRMRHILLLAPAYSQPPERTYAIVSCSPDDEFLSANLVPLEQTAPDGESDAQCWRDRRATFGAGRLSVPESNWTGLTMWIAGVYSWCPGSFLKIDSPEASVGRAENH